MRFILASKHQANDCRYRSHHFEGSEKNQTAGRAITWRLISSLPAQALRERKSAAGSAKLQCWIAKPMRARINLADREALFTRLLICFLYHPHKEKSAGRA
jgi:hypothetical protein